MMSIYILMEMLMVRVGAALWFPRQHIICELWEDFGCYCKPKPTEDPIYGFAFKFDDNIRTMDTVNRFGSPAPAEHLVKYENPKLLSEKFIASTPKRGAKKPPGSTPVQSEDVEIVLPTILRENRKERNIFKVNEITSTEDILDSILPPRLWVDNGNHYIQKVSRIPATRMDILSLQERMDIKLEQLQARETGICPIRRELYSQAFDELIRQATLECAERGLMLLRVRDEIRMTIAAYQTLFESSMAYGMRKVLLAEQGKNECASATGQLFGKAEDLHSQLSEWQDKCEALERKNQELVQQDAQRKLDELAAVKRTNSQLATVLDNIILQRTLVFNVGSGTGDIVPPTQPTKPADDHEEHVELSKTPESDKEKENK